MIYANTCVNNGILYIPYIFDFNSSTLILQTKHSQEVLPMEIGWR